jgi:hypothetical protein
MYNNSSNNTTLLHHVLVTTYIYVLVCNLSIFSFNLKVLNTLRWRQRGSNNSERAFHFLPYWFGEWTCQSLSVFTRMFPPTTYLRFFKREPTFVSFQLNLYKAVSVGLTCLRTLSFYAFDVSLFSTLLVKINFYPTAVYSPLWHTSLSEESMSWLCLIILITSYDNNHRREVLLTRRVLN